MRFTKEEFDIMVNELLYNKTVCFDMLCQIAEKTLKPSVVYWCNSEICLRGRKYENDIMQEIYLRLIKTTVDYFLLRDGVNGAFNDDPEGFEDWMFRVAENLKRDFIKKVRNDDFKTENIEVLDYKKDCTKNGDDSEVYIERLTNAVSIVLSAEISVYKVLTWFAQFVFIMDSNITKIESTELIINIFENKTLYEMYDMLLNASKRIPWIVITEQQNKKILNALRKNCDGTVTYGETKYKSFFMKHNGEVVGKKSVSDWVNRMNGLIKRKTDEKTANS